jgi:molybdopterin synthase sulfur carrier subunit
MITAHVKLFATLRGRYPHLGLDEAMAVELPDGATVEDLLEEHLCLPANQVKLVFVNGVVRGEDHRLADGDEVTVFPPVGGG